MSLFTLKKRRIKKPVVAAPELRHRLLTLAWKRYRLYAVANFLP